MNGRNRLLWLIIFAVAMGLLEAAVVVYLRELYYPENVLKIFPAKLFSIRDLVTELSREVATMVMLFSVGWLAERNFWRRFAAFMTVWGIWDITYYFWLKVFIGWPTSLIEFDILFLIPVAWIGPVLAPMMIALVMSVFGGYVVWNEDVEPKIDAWSVTLVAAGGLIDFLCFIWPSLKIAVRSGAEGFRGFEPSSFAWIPFMIGWVIFTVGVGMAALRGKGKPLEVENG